MSQEEDGLFTPTDATNILNEVDSLTARCRQSLDEGRFVEAEAWITRAKDALNEDVFGELAAGEAIAVKDVGTGAQR